jgi:hypothetical protein
MSFENASLERADLERMHEKALDVIEESRIKEEDFVNYHGEIDVEKDLKEVARREGEFSKGETRESNEMKKVADIFEALVLQHGELSNWFGENATTVKTSKFDDYVNGVDLLVEFGGEDDETTHLGLAADVTFMSDTTKKFDRIRRQIDEGGLAEVRYFHSDSLDTYEVLSKLPEVIIGAEKRTVMELAELWAERQNKELAEHRIQIMILEQMKGQLETFSMYAESIGKDEVAVIYRERLAIVEKILEEKKLLAGKVKYELNSDNVHASIMSFLTRWRQGMITEKAA